MEVRGEEAESPLPEARLLSTIMELTDTLVEPHSIPCPSAYLHTILVPSSVAQTQFDHNDTVLIAKLSHLIRNSTESLAKFGIVV